MAIVAVDVVVIEAVGSRNLCFRPKYCCHGHLLDGVYKEKVRFVKSRLDHKAAPAAAASHVALDQERLDINIA
jgi:hypothetical protein